MYFTSDTLIASVKNRALIPSSQPTFLPADFLRFANEEMMIKIVPAMMAQREDYFLYKLTIPVQANVSEYSVPERAIGNNFKDLFYIDQNQNRYMLSRMNIQELAFWQADQMVGTPYRFYMKGDRIVLLPPPNQSVGVLEVWVYQRPNDLVSDGAVGQITAITTGSTTVTYSVNANVSGYESFDILSSKSPFQLWAQDLAAVSATSTSITFDLADVVNAGGSQLPIVGDYVCEAKKANIPMIPEEAHPLLAELIAARVIQSFGDGEKLAQIDKNIAVMTQAMLMLLANRPEQRVEQTVNRNGLGWRSGFSGRYW